MMGDHHYENQLLAPQWARKCNHCGRYIHRAGGIRYGSNACRQAAYRARLKRYVDGGDRGRDLSPSRNAGPLPRATQAMLEAARKRFPDPVIDGKRFRGKQKGGAL